MTKKKNSRRERSPKNGSRKAAKAERSATPADAPRDEKPEPLTIVGIGASAGGLAALKTFFEHVPEDSGLAYVLSCIFRQSMRATWPKSSSPTFTFPCARSQRRCRWSRTRSMSFRRTPIWTRLTRICV